MQRGLWAFIFLLLAILSGPSLIMHVPPGHAPDERGHVLRADSLLYGALIGHREYQDGRLVEGAVADAALSQIITLPTMPLDRSPQAISPVQKWLATQVRWGSKPAFVQFGSVAGYFPLFYVPGAVAIALCRTAGLSPYGAFLGVRSANFYCFLLLGAIALRVTRRGTLLMFVTLLLPMTVSLAASGSQDGLLIAGSACAMACLTQAIDLSGTAQAGWRAAAAALLSAVAAGKPFYAPLALLLLLPMEWNVATLARRSGVVALTILPALAWSFLESRVANVATSRPAAEAGPLWPGARPAMFTGPDPLAQIHVLLSHKALAALLPLQAVADNAGALLQQAVGVLDYMCLYLPDWLYLAWYAGLVCAIAAHLCACAPSGPARWSDLLVACAAYLLCVIAIGLALYLDWTPVGMTWIGGIQGRYFLPLLPALALCLPRFSHPRLAAALSLPCVLAALLSAAALPGIVSSFYPLAAKP